MTDTDPIVQAVAEALHAVAASYGAGGDWEDWTEESRAAVAAARPLIAAEAWDDLGLRGLYDALAGSDRDASESPAVNPYRQEDQ